MLEGLETAIHGNRPVCLYRKPSESKVNGIFQNSRELVRFSDFDGKGFVFAPFDNTRDTILIRADQTLQAVYKISQEKENPKEFADFDEGKKDFLDLVRKGKEGIANMDFGKVVLSKKMSVEHHLAPKEIFIRLLNSYSEAFCYLFFHPEVGLWCGATPEVFLQIQDNLLKTMSLAGTLPFVEGSEPQWTIKEKEEQEIVTRFISSKLSPMVNELEISGPFNAKAGNLWHLKTNITGTLATDVPLSRIIRELHPTPAVCGFPQKASKDFIIQNEGYDRKYYTGFLGELGLGDEGNTSLFVNLRCMELIENQAHIYVGGGVTADSSPELEWDEIRNKSKTMLCLL